MKRSSIQNRVLIGSVLAVAGTIGITGVVIHRAAQVRMRAHGREVLRVVLEAGAQRVAAESIFATRNGDEELGEIPGITRPDQYWSVRRAAQEKVLARSSDFPAIEVDSSDLRDPDLGAGGRTVARVRETVGEDGLAYRVAALVLEPTPRGMGGGGRGPGPPWMDGERGGERGRRRGDGPRRGPEVFPFQPGDQFAVFVATPIQSEVDSLADLAKLLAMAGLGAVLVAALSIRFVVRRGLAPLDELSLQVAAIRETDLDEVIEVDDAPAELVPIVTSFDSTRARLAKAFAREKRFTADAAHELRTPIAGMRATLEVVLRRERSTAEHREAAAQCLDIALSMQETVESLLLLARSGSEAAERGPVDMEAALRRAFSGVAETLDQRRLTVRYRTSESGTAVATGVPALFERIAANLASNAASYAIEGSAIDVVATSTNGDSVLMVANECDPLPADTSERAFEPFWRADVARTDKGAHTGLGLALVRTCAEAMDGTATLACTGRGSPLLDHSIVIRTKFDRDTPIDACASRIHHCASYVRPTSAGTVAFGSIQVV